MSNNQSLIDQYLNLSSHHVISQDHPNATILIGQSGSGKEVLTTQAQDEFHNSGGSILVDHELLKVADPQTADQASDHLISEAAKNKYNLVISKDFDHQTLDSLTESLKEQGYHIDVRAMGSPQSLDEYRKMEQSVHSNINLGIDESHFTFLHGKDLVSEQLKHLELENKVDEIHIYDRVGNEVYQNQKDQQNVWQRNEHAYNVYNFERNKPLLQDEQDYLQLAQHQLNELKNTALINQNHIQISKNNLEKTIELTLDQPKFIRDVGNFKGIQKGIVVDENKKFMLLKVNNMVGIRYDKAVMKDDAKAQENTFRVGQELYINHSGQSQNVMSSHEIQQYQEAEIQQHIDNEVNLNHER